MKTLADVQKILQLFMSKLAKKRGRRGAFEYEINQFPSGANYISHLKKLTIVDSNTDYELDITYKELDDQVEFVKSVKIFKYMRLIEKYEHNQEITNSMVQCILHDFGRALLPQKSWSELEQLLNPERETVSFEDDFFKNGYDKMAIALASGKIVALKKDPETGNIRFGGDFEDDSDAVLCFAGDNPEQIKALWDTDVVFVKGLHELCPRHRL